MRTRLPMLGLLAAALIPACTTPYGPTHSGQGTFYTLTGMGNCSYPEYPGNGDTAFAAMNEADYGNADLCGAWVQVTGPKGTTSVKIIDRCPECRPGDIDLSAAAFAKIADPVAGRVSISWRLASGPEKPPISYRFKDGSSQWWIGIQALNHRNPVRSLEVQVGTGWQTLQRQRYNYFLAPSGLGTGPFTIRLTDTFGESVISTGIRLSTDTPQPTTQQFAAH